jgi:hypothetical protein
LGGWIHRYNWLKYLLRLTKVGSMLRYRSRINPRHGLGMDSCILRSFLLPFLKTASGRIRSTRWDTTGPPWLRTPGNSFRAELSNSKSGLSFSLSPYSLSLTQLSSDKNIIPRLPGISRARLWTRSLVWIWHIRKFGCKCTRWGSRRPPLGRTGGWINI